jgi:hypothetical protein
MQDTMRLLQPLPAQRMTVIKRPRPSKAMTTMRPQLQSKRLLRKMHTAAMKVTQRHQRLIMMRPQHLLHPQRMVLKVLTLPLIPMPTVIPRPQSQPLPSRLQTFATHR